MLRCLFFPCAVLLAAHAQCAGLRMGEIDVREGNAGVPCFTISEEEQARSGAPQFQSISVREAGVVGKGAAAWHMEMPRQRTFAVTFQMCIPYAGRLPVLPQTWAAPLKNGQLYEVAIDVRAPLPKEAPRGYRGWFCMEADRDGVAKVRAVGTRRGGARACRRQLATP